LRPRLTAGLPLSRHRSACEWLLLQGSCLLRPQVASAIHATNTPYSYPGGVYVRKGTKYVRAPRKRRTSQNSVKWKFAEFPFYEVG
jgi:hypothetical protein